MCNALHMIDPKILATKESRLKYNYLFLADIQQNKRKRVCNISITNIYYQKVFLRRLIISVIKCWEFTFKYFSNILFCVRDNPRVQKNKNFQNGCEKYYSKHEAAIDENGWNHRCKGIKNRNKGAMVVNIKTINIVYFVIYFILYYNCLFLTYKTFTYMKLFCYIRKWMHFLHN